MSSQQHQWFVPADGIDRHVITADIQRYLGPDALVRPGESDGVQGYWITAYRTLTTQMLQDLRMDSQRWQVERERGGGGTAYQDSTIHASRQYYGSTSTSDNATATAYDPAPSMSYGSVPRSCNSFFPTASQSYGYSTPSNSAAPGSYTASDGHHYALAQQPQLSRQPRQAPASSDTRPSTNVPISNSKSEFLNPSGSQGRYMNVQDPQFQSALFRKKRASILEKETTADSNDWQAWFARRKAVSDRHNSKQLSESILNPLVEQSDLDSSNAGMDTIPSTAMIPTDDDFWDRFELAAVLEKFFMDQLTDTLLSDMISDGLALVDAQDGAPSHKSRASSGRPLSGDHSSAPSKKRGRKDDSSSREERNPNGSDEDSEGEQELPRKRTNKVSSSRTRGLRCPFYCHDPDKYCQQACSSASGFPNMTRLVQHLKRGHWQKQAVRCPRCQGNFESNQQLEEHLNAEERCPRRERIKDNCISISQWEDIIDSRPKDYNDYCDEQKWQYLYKGLFPADERVPSAYARPIMIDQLQDPLAASIEEVLADEWGSFVCESFQNLIGDLKAKMPMILQRAQEKVDSRREDQRPEKLGKIPRFKLPQSDKGKGKATDGMMNRAQDVSQSPIPSLANISTGNLNEPRLPDEFQTNIRLDQDGILFNVSEASCMGNDTINPHALGIVGYDTDFVDNKWDDPLEDLLTNPTLTAGNSMQGNPWGS